MKRFALSLLLAAGSLFAASGDSAPLASEQASGDVRLLMVKGPKEYTVFASSRSCDTASVIIGMVFADQTPGALRTIRKSVALTSCGENSTPARITFETDGRPVLEFRVTETTVRANHVFRP